VNEAPKWDKIAKLAGGARLDERWCGGCGGTGVSRGNRSRGSDDAGCRRLRGVPLEGGGFKCRCFRREVWEGSCELGGSWVAECRRDILGTPNLAKSLYSLIDETKCELVFRGVGFLERFRGSHRSAEWRTSIGRVVADGGGLAGGYDRGRWCT
jgi:hypothetical protein